MGTPEYILLSLITIRLGIAAALHGKPLKENWSFPITFFRTGLLVLLLWWGGFFL